MSAPNKDFPQVLKESYDPAQERIRVDASISDGVDTLIVNSDGSINVRSVQIFTKPFQAITRVYPDPSPGVEVYQTRLVNDTGPIQETATVTYADGASKQEFLKVVVT